MTEYCLRWNNHQPNLVNVFSELLNTEGLVDVTLATDGQFIQAHKLVLSACSAYFKELFGNNPCKHPIVFLKDIRFEDLRTVVDFIYKGEVNVTQERLQDVLRTAESLKIKGLADRPLSFEEHSSQTRGHPASAFSSQKSSLSDSREQHQSLEDAENGVESRTSSPPAFKKRKITLQESSESGQGNAEEEDTQPVSNSEKDEEAGSRDSKVANVKEEPGGGGNEESSQIKKEDELSASSEIIPEYQESRAADAMLLLQGSSSETEGGGGISANASSNSIRGEVASNILASHTQGRSKRGTLQRQPGIIREVVTEEQKEDSQTPEYILPEKVTPASFASSVSISESIHPEREAVSLTTKSTANPKLLQVPTVVVGSVDSNPFPSTSQSKHATHSKSLLVVPTSSSNPTLKQSTQLESRLYQSSSLAITKQSSHPGVLSHTTTVSLEPGPSTSSASSTSSQVALIPMQLQLIPKQKSSPGSLPSSQCHLRPIQPKPSSTECEMWAIKKDPPIIQFTYTEDDLFAPRLPRAISEEPQMMRMPGFESLSPLPSPLIQSVSQDTGLDASTNLTRLVPPHSTFSGVSLSRLSSGAATSVSHTPVLREGPALGCNFCWNTQDAQGRVQRRKTKYHCPDCRTNLCIVPCFHEYHSQMQVKQDQNKQITKILTKTSSM